MYLARKGNAQFHVQDTEIERFADAGYTILKETYTEVTDVSAEAASIGTAGGSSSAEELEEG